MFTTKSTVESKDIHANTCKDDLCDVSLVLSTDDEEEETAFALTKVIALQNTYLNLLKIQYQV